VKKLFRGPHTRLRNTRRHHRILRPFKGFGRTRFFAKGPSGPSGGGQDSFDQFITKRKKDVDEFFKIVSKTPFTLKKFRDSLPDNLSVEQIESAFDSTRKRITLKANSKDFNDDYYRLNTEQIKVMKDLLTKLEVATTQVVTKHKVDMSIVTSNLNSFSRAAVSDLNEPIRVAITGGAGQIGYALIYRIASGAAFGPFTPVILHLLEVPQMVDKLKGVQMELEDCAFPTLKGIVITDKPEVAFEGVDWALLVGAKPRGPGMERGDLLTQNAEIFSVQGKALNKVAKGKNTRVLVVGNPANTNAMICQRSAPNIPSVNFGAMTKLDHNRGLAQLAKKIKCLPYDIKKFVIWGNHSATQFPDITYSVVNDKKISDLVDKKWLVDNFIPTVQKRGAEIIAARGLSSAASAGSALIDNVREWYNGTFGDWTSAAVYSNGEYGITPGLFYSYPVTFSQQQWSIVKDLPIDSFQKERMESTHKELLGERDAIAKLLK